MNIPSIDQLQQDQEAKAKETEMEERRNMILDQILDPSAKERLSRLSLVKKEKARAVGDSLIRAATNGSLKGKVTEEQLIAMLEQISGEASNSSSEATKSKSITFQRKKFDMDDDEDDDDSDLI